jgi:hypothetical protein
VFLLTYAFTSVTIPWHAADHAYVTSRPAAVTTVTDRQAALDDQLAAEMTRLRCTPPQLWKAAHPRGLPAAMILKRDRTFTLTTVAWTYPAPSGYWTVALCAKEGQ